MNVISFPGLGIDNFELDPVAFTLFGRDVMWYGVIITFGIICACLYAKAHLRYESIDTDTFFDLAFCLVLLSIAGARLYYVIFYGGFVEKGGSFWQNLTGTLYNVIAIWNGGLAIYGAIITGAVVIFVFGMVRHVNIVKMLDAVGPAVLLGQAIGRWGNFTNAEAHGGETDIFCRMGIQYGGYGEMRYYHPTFLYESLWNIIGVIILTLLYKKKKHNGQIVLGYFCWYGFGRMLIEGLRTDSLYIGSIRVSQLVGLICFAVSVVLLLAGTKWAEKIPALRLDALSGCEAKCRAEEEAEQKAKEKRNAKKTSKIIKNTEVSENGEVPESETVSEEKDNGNN